jgi:hypothetical protein
LKTLRVFDLRNRFCLLLKSVQKYLSEFGEGRLNGLIL